MASTSIYLNSSSDESPLVGAYVAAPMATKHPVPNHLIDTRTFSKIGSNNVVQAKPPSVHFAGFQVGQTSHKVIKIINKSTDCQRWHVIPTTSPYFRISYVKEKQQIPGSNMSVRIEFTPDEWRYYYDSVKVHAAGDETLVVPIHAYPIMSPSGLPFRDYVTLPSTPIGDTVTHSLPLTNTSPVDFEFRVHLVESHPAFEVAPLSGSVPGDGGATIVVRFRPREYATVRTLLEIVISEFGTGPFRCSIVGTSEPNLLKKLRLEELRRPETVPRRAPPSVAVPRAPSSGAVPRAPPSGGLPTAWVDDETPPSVGRGKPKAPPQKEPTTRQTLEALFEQRVRKEAADERANELRWAVRLGAAGVGVRERETVAAQRVAYTVEYRRSRGDPQTDPELVRRRGVASQRRLQRGARREAPSGDSVNFDSYANRPWGFRAATLNRFRQGARRAVLRGRARRRVGRVRAAARGVRVEDVATSPEFHSDFRIESGRVLRESFPVYSPPERRDDLAPDALGPVATTTTHVHVEHAVPFHRLSVPMEFRVLGYRRLDGFVAGRSYVPTGLPRPLLRGAEDEEIELPPPESRVRPPVDPVQAPEFPPLTAWLHPLHVFNPEPGIQSYSEPLPYSETDPDFALAPAPRYTRVAPPRGLQRHNLVDPEEVVRGVMAWRRFPCQSLVHGAVAPGALHQVWVPRRPRHPAPSDLDVDALESRLSRLEGRDHPLPISLTPDMVAEEFESLAKLDADKSKSQTSINRADEAAFLSRKSDDVFPNGSKLPMSNNPVNSRGVLELRGTREYQLEALYKREGGKLGEQLQAKTNQLNSLITSPSLTLK